MTFQSGIDLQVEIPYVFGLSDWKSHAKANTTRKAHKLGLK